MFIIGIDPGLGVKSATGLFIFDSVTFEIKVATAIWTKETRLQNKLYDIASEVRDASKLYLKKSIVVTEYFVMRGRGGESLQRLMGALFAALKDSISILEVQNVRVKLALGGSGKASKEEVAEGVYSYFEQKNEASASYIAELIEQEQWDLLDAAAIAITGYLDSEARIQPTKAVTRNMN